MNSLFSINTLQDHLNDIHKTHKTNHQGHLASYIPELAKVNPDLFAISVTLVDGKTFNIGDFKQDFTIQSTSKPFTYGLALKDHGSDYVHSKIGVEPSGEAFNSIIELEKKTHRPFNPMINSGAIAVADMIQNKNDEHRVDRMTHLFTSLVGRPVKVNHNIFESEKRTAYRNKAIAYLLKHFNVISDDIDGALDLYFKQCSISMNCEDLSMMAATLAHQGVQPRTKENIYSEEIVNQILSLVFSCGMYDTAGTWSFSVGIPAKSGVSGAMFAVIPGKMGISCYSPLINEHGHSIRGVLAISDLAKLLDYNLFKK